MLTIAYCRVSTDEQAEEGYSIEGQARKLREYAQLHDLGPVLVVDDPGQSGKNLDRSGVQRVLAMIDEGHVKHLLVWRLDRLSRNLGDLIDLADRCNKAGVALHSFTEKLDLSSPTGRMFYNILGTFAQFYREQLGENVRMGLQQAARDGKWVNRPKFGYDLVDGHLVPNTDSPIVRQIFTMRSQGSSYHEIESATGVRFSTARGIVHSRIYLGEVLNSGTWYPGRHEPIITEQEFLAAHKAHVPGRSRRATHSLSGRVRCGLCQKVAGVKHNGNGTRLYRCWSRGSGCRQPARSVLGMERATVLGLRLLSEDTELRDAIRVEIQRRIEESERPLRPYGPPPPPEEETITEKRRELLTLLHSQQISPDLIEGINAELSGQVASLRAAPPANVPAEGRQTVERFEEVAAFLMDLDMDRIWSEATEAEQRVLVQEMLEGIWIYPDHLEVKVAGTPKLNVTLDEVGLKPALPTRGVGERTRTSTGLCPTRPST